MCVCVCVCVGGGGSSTSLGGFEHNYIREANVRPIGRLPRSLDLDLNGSVTEKFNSVFTIFSDRIYIYSHTPPPPPPHPSPPPPFNPSPLSKDILDLAITHFHCTHLYILSYIIYIYYIQPPLPNSGATDIVFVTILHSSWDSNCVVH